MNITINLLDKNDSNYYLKLMIWIYFTLLIFEGGLRKWILPGLATPLLIVRDPIAIYLLYYTWKKGILPSNIYIKAMVLIGVLGIITSLVFGHGNIIISIFGARILILHFTLIFVIGKIFEYEDVIKVGKVMMWISIPMAVLISLQFYSPQSSWVNRGVGGDISGAGFSGALGFFRPSGTFSFTNGLTFFFSLLSCYIFYFWLNKNTINRFVLIGSTIALLVAIPLSISRSLLFSVIICALFTFITMIVKPRYLKQLIIIIIGLILILIILLQISFFQTAIEAFSSRFNTASSHEGGLEGTLVDRYLGDMINALGGREGLPFFGYGIGFGTNVAAVLTTGDRTFLFAEGEWPRIIGELGVFLGISVLIIRVVFCAQITFESFKKLRYGDILPWTLLSFCLLNIPQGQWAQPTALGFSTLIGGLLLACLKDSSKDKV